jgi:hypothetical protein
MQEPTREAPREGRRDAIWEQDLLNEGGVERASNGKKKLVLEKRG